MPRRNWRAYNPKTLREAIEACKDFAIERKNRSVERIAELMGEESHWTVYGWMRDGSIPGKKIPAFEHACGCDFVTRWLAHANGMLLIPIPHGHAVDMNDVHRLQGSLNNAVAALLGFASGGLDAEKCADEINKAQEALAWHRENAQKFHQPELDLDNHE